MKKEITQKTVKATLPQVMEKYGGVFSVSLSNGFAHLSFENGEMVCTWLNEEGYVEEDGHKAPFKDIERVADFMREMKELRLNEYTKVKPYTYPATN